MINFDFMDKMPKAEPLEMLERLYKSFFFTGSTLVKFKYLNIYPDINEVSAKTEIVTSPFIDWGQSLKEELDRLGACINDWERQAERGAVAKLLDQIAPVDNKKIYELVTLKQGNKPVSVKLIDSMNDREMYLCLCEFNKSINGQGK